jgi:hypothetical protein
MLRQRLRDGRNAEAGADHRHDGELVGRALFHAWKKSALLADSGGLLR